MTKERKNYTNDLLSQHRAALMGISILSIMFYHFTEDCISHGVHEGGLIQWFYTYIHSSSVDAFLFLSGLGLYYSMKKNPDVVQFYRKRLVKILVPYLLVALPAWGWMDFIYKKEGIRQFWQDISFLSMREGTRWFWYILMILFCYLIYPYVFRIVEHARDELEGELCLLSLVGVVTVTVLLLKLYATEFYENYEVILTRIPIFLAGCFYGRSSYEHRNTFWKWGAVFLFSVLGTYLLPVELPILGRFVKGLLNVSICAGIAVLFTCFRLTAIEKILNWFGNCSLELYLLHVAIRKILKALECETFHYRYEFIVVAGSMILAFGLNKLCDRMTPVLLKKRKK